MGVIVYRDGKAYEALVNGSKSGRPEVIKSYYRVLGNPKEGLETHCFEHDNTCKVFIDYPRAVYYPYESNPRAVVWQETIEVPPPKVRPGTPVRWNIHLSRWEKLLKSRGWVSVDNPAFAR